MLIMSESPLGVAHPLSLVEDHMPHATNDPSRTLPPLPDGALVRIRLTGVGSFLAAPFGPLSFPDPSITVETTIQDLAPLEHHWKRSASGEAWRSLAALQPAGEQIS